MTGAVERAERILRAAAGERVRTSFSMAALTTFRIGGPAAIYLEPDSDHDLRAVTEAVTETGLPFVVIGKGSNVLVSDEGFAGIVLRLGRSYRWAARDGERLSSGGAMPLPALSGLGLSHDLAGLEFGVAIPASVGGAVRMNAGAHGMSVSEVVDWIEVYVVSEGVSRSVPGAEAGYRYRGSDLPDDGIVTSAVFGLVPGDRGSIRARMDEAREWRRATQPLAEPNCGSVFKNPQGRHAARMIEELGAKGLAVGGASVSTKHANFIVAGPGARAADVVALIRRLQEMVADRYGVRLEPEVHLVGDFDLAPL